MYAAVLLAAAHCSEVPVWKRCLVRSWQALARRHTKPTHAYAYGTV